MMEQFAALYPSGTVRYSQTSSLELTTTVEVHRIDFRHRVAAHLKRGTGGEVTFCTDHPALLYYNGPITALTFSISAGASAAFLAAYEQCLTACTTGWRAFLPTWSGIGKQLPWLNEWLRRGNAYTIYAPEWVADEIVAVCKVYGAETRGLKRGELLHSRYFVLKPLRVEPPFNALFIGQNYIIARDFYVSTLR